MVRIAWNKGLRMSKEHKKKLSEAHKGQISWNKGLHLSKEHKKRLSESHKGKPTWNKGIPMKEESKRKLSQNKERALKISQSLKGKDFSEEHRKHLAEHHRTKRGFSSPMKGKHLSEEARAKDSERVKRLWQNPEYRAKIIKANKEFVLNAKNIKKCKHCGKEFIDKTTNNEAKFCSPKCKQRWFAPMRKGYFREYIRKNWAEIYKKSKAYFSTPKGKEVRRKSLLKRKDNLAEYRKSPKGRLIRQFVKHRRREREREVSHSFTKSEWLNKIKLTKGICPVCKNPFDENLHKITLDHNPPISKAPKGFVYTINDIEPICFLCNSKKGNRN